MVDAQEGQTVCISETGGRQELTLRISWAESLLLFRWDAQVLGALPLLTATSTALTLKEELCPLYPLAELFLKEA